MMMSLATLMNKATELGHDCRLKSHTFKNREPPSFVLVIAIEKDIPSWCFESEIPMATLRIIPIEDKFKVFAHANNVAYTGVIERFFEGCNIGQTYEENDYARLVADNELDDLFMWARDRADCLKCQRVGVGRRISLFFD